MALERVVTFAVPVFTVVLLHAVIVTGHPAYAFAALAFAPAAHLMIAFARGGGWRQKGILCATLFILAALQAATLVAGQDVARLIVVPPVIVHGALAWTFGRSLLPGREPLIHRFSRFSRGRVPAELTGYTRTLTIAWTVMFAAMAVIAAGLGVMAEPETWSWVVNIGMPAMSAVLFLGEHAYRAVVYRHLGHNSPLGTLRTLVRAETWTAP